MKILSRPNGNAQEYGRWAVNPYKGCPNGCLYCYLKKGVWVRQLGGDTAMLKDGIVSDGHAYYIAMAEILGHFDEIVRDGGLFMTFTSDPLVRRNRGLMLSIAHNAVKRGIHVTILTKDATFTDLPPSLLHVLRLEDEENWRRNIYFYHAGSYNLSFIPSPHFDSAVGDNLFIGFTLTGHDELEPNASPNEGRIECMRRLSERGFKTWASIEPVIDFDSSYDMIQEALEAGCRHFKIGLMTKNTKVCRNGFNFGGYGFYPYDPEMCMQFVGFVMEATDGRATVYWKNSFYDFFGDEPIHGMSAHEFFHQWEHSVGMDFKWWNQK